MKNICARIPHYRAAALVKPLLAGRRRCALMYDPPAAGQESGSFGERSPGMLPSTPTPPTVHRTTSTAARERPGAMDTLHAWGRRLPRPWRLRPGGVGSRVLTLGLVACLAFGSVTS